MRIRDDGRLSVNFRTEARFRGLFVADHEGTDLTAMVMSSEHPDLTFTLQPIRSEPTYEQPEQTWEFVSDLAVSIIAHNCCYLYALLFTVAAIMF